MFHRIKEARGGGLNIGIHPDSIRNRLRGVGDDPETASLPVAISPEVFNILSFL